MSILFATSSLVVWLILFLVVWLIFEFVTLKTQGLHHRIKGNGRLFLEKEFSDCGLNSLDSSIICLRNTTELNGFYVSTTGTSILFPYYFSNQNNVDYGILIFSKEYFIVRNKFKELKKSFGYKKKRLKFSNVV